ncbi:hypothetical protein HF086_001919 [Spodoptera exigua]|uniref:Attacin n=1 Tax=Spodoptera exigua TaxID=7107 RepID=A0A922MER4_SPOEX|nr:hypothetical protein HF086_001919 [Spodoptera exigua]
MYSALLLAAVVVGATAWETVPSPEQYLNLEDYYQYLHEPSHRRETRQLHGNTFFNTDGTSGIGLSAPFGTSQKNTFSAIGGANFDAARRLQSASYGLAMNNANGHGLSLTNTHITDFGNQFKAAGYANLFRNQNHDVSVNAYFAKNRPQMPQVPSFNTVGAGVDYMFKNKVGGSVGVAHTPYFDKTDYSFNGNVNLLRNRGSSLDFNAGLSKSVSPFLPNSRWEPSTGFTFRKFF